LRAVLLDKITSVENDLDAIMAQASDDPMGVLEQLLASMQRHTEEIQPPFVRDIRRESPELFQLVEERRRAMIQRYFGQIFAAGRRAGSIRRDVSTELVVEILLGAVQAIMNPAKIEELGLTPKTGYAAIISVTFTAILFELMKSGFALYFRNANYASTYGALGFIAIVVIYVYYMALAFIIGGEVGQVASLQRIRRRQKERLG
jgi:hypothetical protein